jgi:FlaA1/EpsC-like NDP-sugar epimerase
MLMVSTDKAVDPSSIMGASKRIAEHILLTQRPGDTVCRKIVRLGNVLGSSGSVVPLFLRQIAHGGPVTVSHPEVSRYFMTLSEAVDALLLALAPDIPAGLLVPPLADPIRILDLAKYLIAHGSPDKQERPDDEVQIIFTGLRPGDKMEESLISSRESYRGAPNDMLREVQTPTLSPNEISVALDDLRTASHMRNLPALLRAVQTLVPEYQPSAHLREQVQAAATVNA